MRILFLTSAFRYGGAQMSSVELAARLKPYHNVKFLDTYGSSKPFIQALINNRIDYNIISGEDTPYIIKKNKHNIFNFHRYLIFVFKLAGILKNVRSGVEELKPDVVLTYDYRCLLYLAGLRKRNFKVVYYARGWYISEQISLIARLLLKKLPDFIICVSESTRQALFNNRIAPLNKMVVIHNSFGDINYDILSVTEKAKSVRLKIIHSGGFLPSKGHHISLHAALLLLERKIDFHLYVCGIIYPGLGNESENYYKELIHFVEKNHLTDRVSFIVGKSNIISYIDFCDIMFFPSSTEGLPRSVMEAMAMGKPVIANAVGGVTDLILDRYTGFLSRFNDPFDYAAIAELLLADRNLYNDISYNAKTLIQKSFNEDAMLLKMNSFLDSLKKS